MSHNNKRDKIFNKLNMSEIKLKPYKGELDGVDGWLSSDGVFYECSCYDHIIIADLLNDKYGYEKINDSVSALNGELTLEKNGWVKISLTRLVHYKDLRLTKRQLDFLFDYYVINGMQDEFQDILEKYYKN